MGRKAESELIKLVHGGGGALWLSAPERRLLKFALDTFGAPLSQVLLSGLGEDDEANRWLFVITFADSGGAALRRRLHVEAPDLAPDLRTHLPHRREPLALLALLKLHLSKRRTTSPRLFYANEEALGLLGWQDTEASRLILDEAVERYYFLSYRYALSRAELAAKKLSFYRSNERLISETGSSDVEEVGRRRREASYVAFSAEFVKGLLARSLFEIEWDTVRRVLRRVIS